MPRPADSFDDEDDPYDPDPPPDPPSGLVLIGLWALLAPPLLLLAVPALLSNTPGGFAALLRVLAGGYVAFAGWALWHWTSRYAAAPPRRRTHDTPDEDEEDSLDDDAEPFA